MIDKLINVLAPHRCSSCLEIGSILCGNCKYDIEFERFSYCLLCARPVGDVVNLCASCSSKPLGGAWCVGWRQAPLKELINQYKFESVRQAAEPLVDLLDSSLPLLEVDLVCEVPTTASHVRQLGYDHAKLLATKLASKRKLPYRQPLTVLSKHRQHYKNRQERFEAAKEMFSIGQAVTGDVVLVDDIVTTGATMLAAAKKLQQAGAENVYLLAIARQKPH